MSKVVLQSVGSGFEVDVINANFQKIQDEFENKIVYRNEPSALEDTLDANGQRIINLPVPGSAGEPVRLQELADIVANGVINIVTNEITQEVVAENAGDVSFNPSTEYSVGTVGYALSHLDVPHTVETTSVTTRENIRNGSSTNINEKFTHDGGTRFVGMGADLRWKVGDSSDLNNKSATNHWFMTTNDFNILCPEWFGAVGDLTTDDSDAFDSMLTYAKDKHLNEGTLVLLSRRYKLTRQLLLSNIHSIKFEGVGTVGWTTTRGPLISFPDNSYDCIYLLNCSGVEFENFAVIARTPTSTGKWLVRIEANYVRFNKMRFLGSGSTTLRGRGIWFRDGATFRMSETHITDIGGTNIILQSACDPTAASGDDYLVGTYRPDIMEFERCRFAGVNDIGTPTTAFYIGVKGGSFSKTDCTTLYVKHVMQVDVPSDIVARGGADTSEYWSGFIWVSGKGTEGVANDYYILTKGNHFRMDNYYMGTAMTGGEGNGLIFNSTFAGPVFLSSPYIRGMPKHGVVSFGTDLTINGGVIARNGSYAASTYSNIRLESTATYTNITGVNCTNVTTTSEPYTNKYGIDVASTSATNLVTGCLATGSLYGIRTHTNTVVGSNVGTTTTWS